MLQSVLPLYQLVKIAHTKLKVRNLGSLGKRPFVPLSFAWLDCQQEPKNNVLHRTKYPSQSFWHTDPSSWWCGLFQTQSFALYNRVCLSPNSQCIDANLASSDPIHHNPWSNFITISTGPQIFFSLAFS